MSREELVNCRQGKTRLKQRIKELELSLTLANRDIEVLHAERGLWADKSAAQDKIIKKLESQQRTEAHVHEFKAVNSASYMREECACGAARCGLCYQASCGGGCFHD